MVTLHLSSDRAAGHRSTDGCHGTSATATDLMTYHGTGKRADHSAGNTMPVFRLASLDDGLVGTDLARPRNLLDADDARVFDGAGRIGRRYRVRRFAGRGRIG
jgi:hypothetical protein